MLVSFVFRGELGTGGIIAALAVKVPVAEARDAAAVERVAFVPVTALIAG
jgi:hypothetical protein